ncbi:uncharacterized protein LOC129737545 [Uranotaenia lowii]|uniref:uncharacterized protein LOC129737545 n=1 Tax=Uranotaenia lowii TaxID=190385 RepID=UPI0024792476|nr:uncharacterized protein LOC129737545 [Uranotaenia lowii]
MSKQGTDWIEMFGLWDVPFNSFCSQVGCLPAKGVEEQQSQFPNNRMKFFTQPEVQQSLFQERFVDKFKQTLEKVSTEGEALAEAIDSFLHCYRPASCAPANKTPAENLLERPGRASLDLSIPPVPSNSNKPYQKEHQFDRRHGSKARSYDGKEHVWVKKKRYKNDQIENIMPKPHPGTKKPSSQGVPSATLERFPEEPENQPSPKSIKFSNSYELEQTGNPRQQSCKPADRPTPEAEPSQPDRSSRTRRVPVRYEPYQLY